MTKILHTARVLLYFMGVNLAVMVGLTAAALAIPLLGVEDGFFRSYYQGFPAMPELMLLLFSMSLGSGGCPTALTLGARRRTLFWVVQLCGAALSALSLLLCGAVGGFAVLLGRSAPDFWPLASLPTLAGYLAICFTMAVLGTGGGLLLLRSRYLTAGVMALLFLLAVALAVFQMLLAPGSGAVWRTPPWPVPVGLGLLLMLGEAVLYGLLSRLTVR